MFDVRVPATREEIDAETVRQRDEIAGYLDRPTGTIKSQLHRARTKLRDLLRGSAQAREGAMG